MSREEDMSEDDNILIGSLFDSEVMTGIVGSITHFDNNVESWNSSYI